MLTESPESTKKQGRDSAPIRLQSYHTDVERRNSLSVLDWNDSSCHSEITGTAWRDAPTVGSCQLPWHTHLGLTLQEQAPRVPEKDAQEESGLVNN